MMITEDEWLVVVEYDDKRGDQMKERYMKIEDKQEEIKIRYKKL